VPVRGRICCTPMPPMPDGFMPRIYAAVPDRIVRKQPVI
jgi:hypothetical protein